MADIEGRSIPTFSAQALNRFAGRCLEAVGVHSLHAEVVARHLVDANLAGHDSHGVGMLPSYIRHAREELVTINGSPRISQNAGSILKVDGDRTWGAIAGRFAINAGAELANTNGVTMVALAHSHHLGRIGAFAEQAAALGLASIHFVNVTDHAPLVAPHGGTEARLGTNPVCIAFPGSDGKPMFLLDMATSWISLGKARVAAARGINVPFGSILDAKGLPTDDPSGVAGFEISGALAPAGGHKGYGLAFAAEILAGVLSSAGTIQPGNPRRGGIQNAMTSILFAPGFFGDQAWIQAEILRMTKYARSSHTRDRENHVLIPGDPERIQFEERTKHGVPIEISTLRDLEAMARSIGLTADVLT